MKEVELEFLPCEACGCDTNHVRMSVIRIGEKVGAQEVHLGEGPHEDPFDMHRCVNCLRELRNCLRSLVSDDELEVGYMYKEPETTRPGFTSKVD